MTISLRQSWAAAVRSPGALSDGVRSWSSAGPATFPFCSLRALCRSLQWPATLSYAGKPYDQVTMPRGPTGEWGDNGEGIAYDGVYWYLVVNESLWYFGAPDDAPPKTWPGKSIIENDGVVFGGRQQLSSTAAGVPDAPYHMGAPALIRDRLYVPVEGSEELASPSHALFIWVFDTATLGYVGRIRVEGTGGSFAWCALTPDGRFMYTSPFGDDGPTIGAIQVYRMPDPKQFPGPSSPVAAATAADELGRFPTADAVRLGELLLRDASGARMWVGHVQGGCISPNGHLYLSIEKTPTDLLKEMLEIYPALTNQSPKDVPVPALAGVDLAQDTRGVLGFDLLTGSQVTYNSSDGDEVEGVFVDGSGVYVQVDGNNVGTDDFTIYQFVATDGDNEYI